MARMYMLLTAAVQPFPIDRRHNHLLSSPLVGPNIVNNIRYLYNADHDATKCPSLGLQRCSHETWFYTCSDEYNSVQYLSRAGVGHRQLQNQDETILFPDGNISACLDYSHYSRLSIQT